MATASPNAASVATAAVNAAQAGVTTFLQSQKQDASALTAWLTSFTAARQPFILAETAEAMAGNNNGVVGLQLIAADFAIGLEAAGITILNLENEQAGALVQSFLVTALNAAISTAMAAA
jgi:hypothetical protein